VLERDAQLRAKPFLTFAAGDAQHAHPEGAYRSLARWGILKFPARLDRAAIISSVAPALLSAWLNRTHRFMMLGKNR
jgi:hypothetical protein